MVGERRVLTLGGSGFFLTSASVFEFSTASPPPLFQIDPSILATLSSSSPDNVSTSTFKLQLTVPGFLTAEEAKASVLLLLYKLLLSKTSSYAAASHLLDILNNNSYTFTTIDLEFNRQEDSDLFRKRWPDITLQAVYALLDYTATSLAKVVDVVAAFSCEALKADTSVFDHFTDSGDGFTDKDAASVAKNLKALLISKPKSDMQFDEVFDIPGVHGCLRSVSKLIRSSARVQLNSPPKSQGSNIKNLTPLFSSLAVSLRDLGKCSLCRAKHVLDVLAKENKYPDLVESFTSKCPDIGKLITFENEENYLRSLHDIYSLSEDVRYILSSEAMVAFISLEGEKRVKKRDKKNKVAKKGTPALMQFIKDKFGFVTTDSSSSSSLAQKVSEGFLSLFDLKSSGFEDFLNKVKDVVDSNEMLMKTPKGSYDGDYSIKEMARKEKAFSDVIGVFKKHGAMNLDTPVFELTETLTGKYGEDSKLIYHLADQDGELLSLRYDHTVPFARYVAMQGGRPFRAYRNGKVYRRDNPGNGRLREFYQCDFDIAGNKTVMADFEVVKILIELLDKLNIGAYEIKLSHRKLLDGMLDICGVPSQKFRTVCSSIDKLDKQSFEQVKNELIIEKGLDAETVEKIGLFVTRRGHPLEVLSELKNEGSQFLNNDSTKQALDDLEKLFQALNNARCLDRVVLDLSLARGLDYYTGVIFEAVFKGETQAIAAGGRYDNLIGKFINKDVAAVGVSLGMDRLFGPMEKNQKNTDQVVKANETQVLVSILGDDELLAMKLVNMCWDAELGAEFMVNKSLSVHFAHAKEFGIPWMVIVGKREIEEETVTLQNEDANVKQLRVHISNFVDELVKLMATPR